LGVRRRLTESRCAQRSQEQFLVGFIGILATEGGDEEIRYQTGLFVKNLFTKADEKEQASVTARWLALSPALRTEIKSKVSVDCRTAAAFAATLTDLRMFEKCGHTAVYGNTGVASEERAQWCSASGCEVGSDGDISRPVARVD
jgi:hypothetical protein